jgi:hypothetical protein
VSAPPEPSSSPFVVVGGRILPHSAYRPAPLAELADTPVWRAALAVLGFLLVGAGVLVGSGSGEATAIGGVVLFLATAVVAGAERAELATALAVAGMVWTAAGISVVTGTDGALSATLIGFAAVGVVCAGAGVLGVVRPRARSADRG